MQILKILRLIFIAIFCFSAYAYEIPALCSGPTALLAIIDRPSVAYSACTVPEKTIYVENGYNYQKLSSQGFGHQFPQTEVRFGLAYNTELTYLPPNYNFQSSPKQQGASTNIVGLKHVAYNASDRIFTFQGLLALPSGNQAFGISRPAFLLNGIYTQTLKNGFSLTSILGLNGTAMPINTGSSFFYSVNPIFLISSPTIKDKYSIYLEFFGQNKISPANNWGVSYDLGFIMLAKSNLTLDLVYGHHVINSIGSLNQYFGGGIVFQLV